MNLNPELLNREVFKINLQDLELEQLVERAQTDMDDGESFAEICRRFTGLVMKYARQNHLAGVFEDAAAEGWLAVVEAVRTYNPTRNIRFAGYVDSRVKYAIWNFFKKNRRRWQMEIPAITLVDGEEVSVLEYVLVEDKDVLSQMADDFDFAAKLKCAREALPHISAKQQAVIKMTVIDKMKLRDVAKQLGITPQAVHNLQKRGLGNLKGKMERMSSAF